MRMVGRGEREESTCLQKTYGHWKRACDTWCERLAPSIRLEGATHAVCRGLDVRQDYLGRKGKTVILHTVMILDQVVELSDVVCQHLDSPVYQRNLSPYARLRRSC